MLRKGRREVRQGIIKVEAFGGPTSLVSLTQGFTDYVYVPAGGGPVTRGFRGSLTAVSDEDWVKVAASGSDDLRFAVGVNKERLPRRAAVRITKDGAVDKFVVAQEPSLEVNLSQTWREVDGTRHNWIPADKRFCRTGEVLESNRATVGNGVTVVLFKDAFNRMEMAVGGVYETSAKESADLFLSLPVVRDFREYFDVYILMGVWERGASTTSSPTGPPSLRCRGRRPLCLSSSRRSRSRTSPATG